LEGRPVFELVQIASHSDLVAKPSVPSHQIEPGAAVVAAGDVGDIAVVTVVAIAAAAAAAAAAAEDIEIAAAYSEVTARNFEGYTGLEAVVGSAGKQVVAVALAG